MKKIILVGGYPPPYGGITVHIKRLKELLDEEGYHTVVVDLVGKELNEVQNVKRFNNGNKLLALMKALLFIAFNRSKIIHLVFFDILDHN